MTSRFIINGQVVSMGKGNNDSFSVSNGNIFINGSNVDMTQFEDTKVFNITIEGDVGSVTNENGDINIHGNSGNVKNMSGDVFIDGNVDGGAITMSGNVVVEGIIAGDVSTVSGNIKLR